MFKQNIKGLGLAMSLAFVLILAACGDSSATNEDIALGGKDIEIPYTGAGSTARSLVLAEVLEDAGYNVTTTPVEASGTLFASAAEDQDTFHASGWFPSTHKRYLDKYGDDLEVYDTEDLIDDVSLSLAVPEYMDDVDSIEDLKDNDDLGDSVDWEITGVDPRTGIMKDTEKGIEDNNLDKWDLEDGDERSMLSKLEESYKKQEPIIITAWKPHWVFDEMDLKMLDDPDKMYSGDDEHINLVFNKKFEKEHPAAHKIATRMAEDWSKEDEEKAMKRIFVDGDDGQKVAEDFVDDHSHKVDKWKKNIADE